MSTPENVNRATLKALVNCMCFLLARLTPIIGAESVQREISTEGS